MVTESNTSNLSLPSQSSFLGSLRGCVNLVVLLVVFPLTSKFLLDRLRYSPASKDLALARGSIIVWTFGAVLLATAFNVPMVIIATCFFAMGNGFSATVRSLVTSLVSPTHVATLNTAVGVMLALGGVIAGPMLALTFKAGLNAGHRWIGLPWWFVAALLAMSAIAVYCVRLTPHYLTYGASGQESEDGAEEEEGLLRPEAEV